MINGISHQHVLSYNSQVYYVFPLLDIIAIKNTRT